MLEVNILTPGFTNLSTRSFLFPILRYEQQIQNRGIDIQIYSQKSKNLLDCSTLIVHNTFYNLFHKTTPGTDKWERLSRKVVNDLSHFKDNVDNVVWWDTRDSSGTLLVEVLDIVDEYYKNQLLANRDRYLDSMYGFRPFTDFYHREFEVIDDAGSEAPTPPGRVESTRNLRKLRVGWNKALADYSPYLHLTKRTFERLPDGLFKRFPWDWFFKIPPHWADPSRPRGRDISARFSTNHDRKTVRFHRQLIAEQLCNRLNMERVNPLAYWQELRNSKVLLSPFGWGEVCWRDFEGFMCGCVLTKPQMDHLETWPPLYEDGETILSVDWEMTDLESTVDFALNNYDEVRSIAEHGQERYKQYLVGESARHEFVDRFVDILLGVDGTT